MAGACFGGDQGSSDCGPTTCFWKNKFTGTRPHPLAHGVSLMLQTQSCIVATQTIWLRKLQTVTSRLFTEPFPCLWLRVTDQNGTMLARQPRGPLQCLPFRHTDGVHYLLEHLALLVGSGSLTAMHGVFQNALVMPCPQHLAQGLAGSKALWKYLSAG